MKNDFFSLGDLEITEINEFRVSADFRFMDKRKEKGKEPIYIIRVFDRISNKEREIEENVFNKYFGKDNNYVSYSVKKVTVSAVVKTKGFLFTKTTKYEIKVNIFEYLEKTFNEALKETFLQDALFIFNNAYNGKSVYKEMSKKIGVYEIYT